MIKVILELASNGIIKTVIDDNINGAGDKMENRTVYEFEEDDNTFKKRIQFITELCEELDIDTGNKYSKYNLKMNVDWGRSYEPTSEEVEYKIKQLTSYLKELKSLKKDIDELDEKI
jgi:hypothetical protein